MYNVLHNNTNAWYDQLNQVHPRIQYYPQFANYYYAYLTCIDMFSSDWD
jgi:hypothetical protein